MDDFFRLYIEEKDFQNRQICHRPKAIRYRKNNLKYGS
nr:MAG TPA: hypothetical protein [Caudoviricetes sp.]